MKLYEIAENFRNLKDLIENDEIEPGMIEEALKVVEGDLTTKLENVTKLMKEIDAECKALKDEEKRLSDRRKALENKSKGLKDYMTSSMILADTKKVKGNLFSFNIQKNRPSLKIESNDNIPLEFIHEEIVFTVDKDGLKKFIEDGNSVDGVVLEASESLRIR